MREVVSNTSPLLYLQQLGLLDLLRELYGRIRVPAAVVRELEEGVAIGHRPLPLGELSWMEVEDVPQPRVLQLAPSLGRGEREAIALAVIHPGALLILDDGLARRYARMLNLTLTGTLGVLLKAKTIGKIPAIRPLLDQLERLQFRLDIGTRNVVLKLADEI